jgi:large subunit ribosomal protein L14
MIQRETVLYSADNSGVKYVKCLKVHNYKLGIPGTLLTVSILRSKVRKRKIRKSEIHKAVLVRTRKEIYRQTGHFIKADGNYIVMLKKRDPLPIASRIKKAVLTELRFTSFYKIMFLAPKIF